MIVSRLNDRSNKARSGGRGGGGRWAQWSWDPNVIRPLFCVVIFAWSMASASAGEDDNPGFGACTQGAKHAPAPVVLKDTYDEARKVIIAQGWKPRITLDENIDSHGNGEANLFWGREYKEISSCSEGRAVCRFNFEDEFGDRLSVYTVGEESTLNKIHAIVYKYEIYCRLK